MKGWRDKGVKRIKSAIAGLLLIALFVMPADASVFSTEKRVDYECAWESSFEFSFGIGRSSDLEVKKVNRSTGGETVLVETTDYSVTCLNEDCKMGGTVTLGAPCSQVYRLVILRNIPLTQESEFTENMPTLYETFEQGLDRLTWIAQQLDDRIDDIMQWGSNVVTGNQLFSYGDPLPEYAYRTEYVTVTITRRDEEDVAGKPSIGLEVANRGIHADGVTYGITSVLFNFGEYHDPLSFNESEYGAGYGILSWVEAFGSAKSIGVASVVNGREQDSIIVGLEAVIARERPQLGATAMSIGAYIIGGGSNMHDDGVKIDGQWKRGINLSGSTVSTADLVFAENDYLYYDRMNNRYLYYIGGTVIGYVDSSGFHNGAPPLASSWQTVSQFQNSWANGNAGECTPSYPSSPCFEVASYFKDPAGVIHLKGYVVNTNPSGYGYRTAIFTLPDGYRPERTEAVVVAAGTTSGLGQVNIDPDGVVSVKVYESLNYLYVVLDGVTFRASGSANWLLASDLQNGWTNASGTSCTPSYPSNPCWERAGYMIDQGGTIHLKGLLNNTNSSGYGYRTPIFTLPQGYRPASTQAMFAPAGTSSGVGQITIDPDGIVSVKVYAALSYLYVGLDGVTFRAAGSGNWQAPTLQNSWTNANTDTCIPSYPTAPCFEQAGYYKDPSGIVHFKGILNNTNESGYGYRTPIFTLPAGYRPGDTHAMPSAAGTNSGTAQINIDPDGIVSVKVYDSLEYLYVGLDGVTFEATQ